MKNLGESTDNAQVNDSNKKSIFASRKLVTLGIAGVLIAVSAIVVYLGLRNTLLDPIVIKVEDQIVLKSEYDDIVNEAKKYKISESKSRQVIIDNIKHEILAKKYDIKLSDYERAAVNRAAAEEFVGNSATPESVSELAKVLKDSPKVVEMAQYTRAIEVQIASRSTKGKQVVIYNFPAVYRLDPNSTRPIDQSDLDFSKSKAEEVRTALINKEMSVNEAVGYLLKSPRFAFANTSNGSGMYYANSEGFMGHMTGNWDNANTGRGVSPDVWNYIYNTNEVGIGEVQEEYMFDSRTNQSILANYFFVDIMRINEGGDELRYEFEDSLKDMKVVEYDI